jgi:hypothetical protein
MNCDHLQFCYFNIFITLTFLYLIFENIFKVMPRLAGDLYIAEQSSTAQHSTAQHSTAQHSTAQHSSASLALFFLEQLLYLFLKLLYS